jgi:hypothetical protein
LQAARTLASFGCDPESHARGDVSALKTIAQILFAAVAVVILIQLVVFLDTVTDRVSQPVPASAGADAQLIGAIKELQGVVSDLPAIVLDSQRRLEAVEGRVAWCESTIWDYHPDTMPSADELEDRLDHEREVRQELEQELRRRRINQLH